MNKESDNSSFRQKVHDFFYEPKPVQNSANQGSSTQNSRTPFPKWLLISAILILLACTILPYLDLYVITDHFRAIGYTPSAEMSAVETSLNLTDSGRDIFYATRPTLEASEAFNQYCESNDVEISVLGCYDGSEIYLYNVTAEELDGIIESTAAHELLHAVWDRLSTADKQSLATQLEAVYQENTELFDEELATYDDSERLDELHSRIGTELADLPAELETHYARWFNDQDAIVAYTDQYEETFDTLKAELDQLNSELDSLETEINQLTADYQSRSEDLNSRIEEFNNCANTAGCFTDAEFNAGRSQLLSEQADQKALYAALEAKVAEYNEKVEQYNNNVLRTNNLRNAINSNAESPAEVSSS